MSRTGSAALSVLVVAALGLPAQVAAAATAPRHGFGVDVSAERAASAHAARVRPMATPPASYDLSQYAPPAGDQGGVNSCSTWATGYTGYGLLMNEQHLTGAPMEPMYVYAQLVHGHNKGTSLTTNLEIEQDQGIDTKADYTPGDFDYTTQPNAAQRANAAHYEISGYSVLPLDSTLRQSIESAVSQGQAVVISFEPRQSFNDVSAANPVYTPGNDGTDPFTDGHSVVVIAYDGNGIKFENTWGPSWGANGFASASWGFVTSSDVDSVYVMKKLVTH
jgi:hypothetical protein